jgi:hypothetical protein
MKWLKKAPFHRGAKMSLTTLTSAWDAIVPNFSAVFTQPTAAVFIELITGWILCTTKRTITDILPFADPRGQPAYDPYHRIFAKSRCLLAQLSSFMRLSQTSLVISSLLLMFIRAYLR